ncbi:MAG: peptidoglycan DD-metalloendopeptidase family protein [Bacteroidales bacterium]|jgi:murein DD-endopeptidase MepM/ murein hydrolase activator NlpD|nr:peptidoglycan DD-metalloendopeptidase family protein [Bacteroidales bacterium]
MRTKNFLKLSFITVVFLTSVLCGQAQIKQPDIDDQSQNRALFQSTEKEDTTLYSRVPMSGAEFIETTRQIPAYTLYGQVWDKQHLRSKQFTIPFSNGLLKIILVESYNTPFVFPCRGELSVPYGQIKKGGFHPGVDFSLSPQEQVYACFDGVVRMAREYGEYGKMVVVRHYNGLETVYGQLQQLLVRPGQIVKAGHTLGLAKEEITKTGTRGTLHFETRFLNETFDPELLLDFEDKVLASNILSLEPADFNISPITISEKAQNQSDTTTSKPQKELPEYYIVQPGETLYRVSLKFNIPVEDLIRVNHLPSSGAVQAGQKLRVSK